MAEIDGGGLHFESTLDNDKLNAAIEDTLKRIQGLSDGTTTAGNVLDKAFSDAGESAIKSSSAVEKAFALIDQATDMNKSSIRELEAEYQKLTDTASTAFNKGDDATYNNAVDRQNALKGEIALRKQLLSELGTQADELSKVEQAYNKEQQKIQDNSNAQASMRTRIRELREEMMLLVDQGIDEQSEAYMRLKNELGRLTDIQSDVQQQARTLANDEQMFQGIISGVSGLSGAFSAATGTVSLFAGENEDLQKVMTRLQSVMAITIGLQQVSQTLNKDSAFQLVTMAKLKKGWASAQALLNTQLGIGVGLSKALMISGVGVLLAGITALVVVYQKWRKEQDAVNEIQRRYVDIQKETAKEVAKSKVNAEQLHKIASDTNQTLGQRNKAIERMKALMPDYNGYIDKEGRLTDNANTAMKNYLTTLYKVEQAKRMVADIQTLQGDLDAIESTDPSKLDWWQRADVSIMSVFGLGERERKQEVEHNKKEIEKEGQTLRDTIKSQNEKLDELLKDTTVFDALFPGEKSKGGGNAGKKKVDEFAGQLDGMKQRYADYARWMNSTDESIRDSASTAFADILQNGDTYLESLTKMRNDLLNKPVTVESASQLLKLNDEIAEQTQAQTDKDEERNKQHVQKLVEDYGKYYDERVRLHGEYLKDIDALNKQLEAETDPGKKATIQTAIDNREKKHDKDLKGLGSGDAEYDAMLKEYATFEQKKQRIAEEYAEKRKKAQENGNATLVNELNKAEQKQLQSVSVDELMNSSNWTTLFSNLDNLTVEKMIELRNTIEAEWGKLNLSPEQLNALRDKIDEVTDEIQSRNPFAALSDSIKRYKAGEKDVTFKEVAKSASASIDLVKGSFDAVVEGFNELGVGGDEVTQKLMGDISNLMGSASELAMGIATGNPLQIIQGGISTLTNAFKVFNVQDRKADRQIARHAENLERLQASYGDLERAIDKALGSGRYTATQSAIKNLEQQQRELAAQADAERGKKKTDKNKVKEYEDGLSSAKDQQQELIDQLRNDLLGLDAKSAAQELGDAFIEAFRSGEDAVEAFGKKADDIVGNIIKKMLVQKLLEQPIGNIIDKYAKKWYNDNGDFIGFDTVMRDANEMGKEIKGVGDGLSKAMEGLPDEIKKYFTGESSAEGSSNSWTGAIKGATEESVNYAAGQMNAIRINQLEAANMLRQQLAQLSIIARNTSYNSYLKSIDERLAKFENKPDSLRSQGLN